MTKSISEILIPLILDAGKQMKRAHDVEAESAVNAKSGTANFVTVYDVQIQSFLMREIKKAIPDAYFIAEEKDNDASALEHPYCFVIDPIDGTTNFIHDTRHSCVSVAMLSFGEPIFGAVYDPYLDELFHAEKGKGAYLNDRPMQVSDRPMNLALVAYGTSPYYKERYTDATFALSKKLFLTCADIRRCGSAALDLAHLAAGRYDVFFECILSPWDIAAGQLLITEAGGLITDMQGKPIDFSVPSSVIAANRACYPALLEITSHA